MCTNRAFSESQTCRQPAAVQEYEPWTKAGEAAAADEAATLDDEDKTDGATALGDADDEDDEDDENDDDRNEGLDRCKEESLGAGKLDNDDEG